MNWALSQRLETHQQQILLYVIADSADPNGVTRHCDPDYMAERARLSRATMFRRLSELEDLGALTRFKFYSDHGAPIYEIRINMDARFDLPIRKRRKDDDDDGSGEGENDATNSPESQPETRPKSQPETTEVSQVRQAQSHSCDSISPPSSKKDSPPNPPPGGSDPKTDQGSEAEPEHFEGFFTGCLGWRTMPRDLALTAFRFLNPEEQGRARAASVLHGEECTKFKRRSKDAHKLIRERFWERYPNARLAEKPPDPVWIDEGPDVDGLRVLAVIADSKPPALIHDEVKGSGLLRRAAVGDDLRALARFVDEDVLDWMVVEPETREFNAWRARLHEWTGRWIEPRVVMRRGKKLVKGALGVADFEAQNRLTGIPVPCRFPPNKTGKIYSDDEPSSSEGHAA